MFIAMTFYKQKRRVFYSSSNEVISSYVLDIYLDEFLSLKTKLSSLLSVYISIILLFEIKDVILL